MTLRRTACRPRDWSTYADWLTQYDHVTFPGAVPRSFVGPLLLAGAASPGIAAARAMGASSADMQVVVRLALALAAWAALVGFARCVFPRARAVRRMFYWICAGQFHLTFWTARTTPNSIAFPLVVAALGCVLGGQRVRCGLAVLAATALTLRLEVLGLAAPAYLWAWLSGRITLATALAVGTASCAAGALLSLAVDSYFWHVVRAEQLPGLGRYVWPEVQALFFNVVDGHSAEWGTSPWYAYWAIELPRLLATTLPMLAAGAVSRGWNRVGVLFVPAFHTSLLSALAHKEWRFVLYTLPLWNAASAVGAQTIVRRVRPCVGRAAWLIPAAFVLASFALSALYTHVSMHNYPGGAALHAAHTRIASGHVRLHIDTLSAMTGVSLFQSTHLARPAASWVPSTSPAWTYDKTEGIAKDATGAWCQYTHLLTEFPCSWAGDAFAPLGAPIAGLAGVHRKAPKAYLADLVRLPRARSLADAWHALLPVVVRTAPALYVCQRAACP